MDSLTNNIINGVNLALHYSLTKNGNEDLFIPLAKYILRLLNCEIIDNEIKNNGNSVCKLYRLINGFNTVFINTNGNELLDFNKETVSVPDVDDFQAVRKLMWYICEANY